MNFVEKGSVKHLIILVFFMSLFGVIIYPLLDLFICKFITKVEFVYNTTDHIIEPLGYGLGIAITLWVVQKIGDNSSKS